MISVELEIPDDLHSSFQEFLDENPDWDQERVVTTALALFLLQNGASSDVDQSASQRRTARVYLDALFKKRSA